MPFYRILFSKCDFTAVLDYFDEQREIKKNRTKDEKLVEKEKNLKVSEEYGFCMWDNHKEKIGNFRLEPPGFFIKTGTRVLTRSIQDCSVDVESTRKWAD